MELNVYFDTTTVTADVSILWFIVQQNNLAP